MHNSPTDSPAVIASKDAFKRLCECLDNKQNFLLEAGAGAGKTYSLVEALKYLIKKEGPKLMRNHQQIACITYTNVASAEINSRTDGHTAILSLTMHAFCWSLIKNFQPNLRAEIPNLRGWAARIEKSGELGSKIVYYDLGYPSIKDDGIYLHHDDVIQLTVSLMRKPKFRQVLKGQYPILFIDEYQDTDKDFADALVEHFIENNEDLRIGFFGDHWQKIYNKTCGKIESSNLVVIGKKANFRSEKRIVEVLNNMRPDLPQQISDPGSVGSVAVFHTNDWGGNRRTESHWKGDMPPDVAHAFLDKTRVTLIGEGWDFAPEKTKILMLTNNVLASEQGYDNLANAFKYSEAYLKKEDSYISFFVDTLEPMCRFYEEKRYGAMFAALGAKMPAIRSQADKKRWSAAMDGLLKCRENRTIGDVLDYLITTKMPRLPSKIEKKETAFKAWINDTTRESDSSFETLGKLREVPYKEVVALSGFIDGHTLFSTKHGVKGAEFQNVLIVFGRGWNLYNFNQMLEWWGSDVPPGKDDTFERNRNLFYVACSRPQSRLALLFTQELSTPALATLAGWFDEANIRSVQ